MINTIEAIPEFITPFQLIIIAIFFTTFSSLAFFWQLKTKFTDFYQTNKPLLPLFNAYTLSTWLIALLSIALIFTVVLYIYDFSFRNSLIASYSIILVTGMIMWFLLVNLLSEFQKGNINNLEDKF